MKLVTCGYRGERRAGIVEGDWVIDVARAHAQRAGDGPAAERAAAALVPPDARGIIEGGAATRAALDAVSTDFGQDVAAWVASGRAAPRRSPRCGCRPWPSCATWASTSWPSAWSHPA